MQPIKEVDFRDVALLNVLPSDALPTFFSPFWGIISYFVSVRRFFFPLKFPCFAQQQNVVEPQNQTDGWVCFTLSRRVFASSCCNLSVIPLFCSGQELWIHLISCPFLCTDNPASGHALLRRPVGSAREASLGVLGCFPALPLIQLQKLMLLYAL